MKKRFFISAFIISTMCLAGKAQTVKQAHGYLHINFLKKEVVMDTLFTRPTNVVPALIYYLDKYCVGVTDRGSVFVAANAEHKASYPCVYQPSAFRGKFNDTKCFLSTGNHIYFSSTIRGTNESQLVEIKEIGDDKYISKVIGQGKIMDCPVLSIHNDILSFYIDSIKHEYLIK